MGTYVFLALFVLLQSQRVDPVSAQQQAATGTAAPSSADLDPRVLVSQDFLDDPMAIIQPVVYSMEQEETGAEMVCPVTEPVLLQPSVNPPFGANGSFYVRSSTLALFDANSESNLKHVRRNCYPLTVPASRCDLLLITGLGSLGRGSFSVIYVPPNGIMEIITEVLYGPPGITFEGSGDDPVAIPPLVFVLRTTETIPSRAMVCEFGDSGSLKESTVLRVLTTRPFPGCRAPIPGTSGGVSSLATIIVRLLNDDVVLTPREILVTFDSCQGTMLRSATLSVTGIDEEEITTAEETTTADTTSTVETSTGSTNRWSSSLPITSSRATEDPNFNGGGVSTTTSSIIGAMVALVLVSVVAVVCVWGGLKLNRRRRRSKPPRVVTCSELENQNNNEPISQILYCIHTLAGPKDVADSGAITDRHTSSASVRSRGGVSTTQDSFVAVHRDCEAPFPGAVGNMNVSTATEGTYRSGSLSETESEGSEVALLREISKHTGVLAKAAMTKSDEKANEIITRIDQCTEGIQATVDYLAEKVVKCELACAQS